MRAEEPNTLFSDICEFKQRDHLEPISNMLALAETFIIIANPPAAIS